MARSIARELGVCSRLAAELNRRQETDYAAEAISPDPPDVRLVSAKGHPTIDLEVVSVPREGDTEQLVREDRNDIRRVEEQLRRRLRERRVVPIHLNLSLQDRVVPSSLTDRDLTRLVDFAAACPQGGHASMADTEVYDFDASLSERVLHASAYRFAVIGGVFADISLGAWLPRDGSWIRPAVQAKARHYAPAVARTLTLVIDAGMLVDDEQVRAFIAEARRGSYPFQAIWIVPRGGVIRQAWPPSND